MRSQRADLTFARTSDGGVLIVAESDTSTTVLRLTPQEAADLLRYLDKQLNQEATK